jgi:hypothetical protein
MTILLLIIARKIGMARVVWHFRPIGHDESSKTDAAKSLPIDL